MVINCITIDCHNTSKQLSYIKENLNLNLANQKISFYSAWSCSICHLELLSNQMTAFPSTILNSCPITGRVAILNYCPIRRLLSIRHLEFLTNQRRAAPPHLPPGIELSLLHYWPESGHSRLVYVKESITLLRRCNTYGEDETLGGCTTSY